MLSQRPTLFALLITIVPLTGHAQTAEIDPDWPDWLKESMQREADLPAMTTLEADGGAYRFSLPAGTELLDSSEGFWAYSIDIDIDTPIACYLYTEDVPMTAIAVEIGELAIQDVMSTSNAKEEMSRSLYHLDAGSVDGAIFIAFEWLSRFRKAGGDLVGHTKVRAAATGEVLQVCWHADAGYRDTFETVFTAFVDSLHYVSEFPEPFAEDITLDTTNGSVTGATYSSLTLLDNGEYESFSYTTSILPVAPGEIQYSDSYYTEYSRPDGTIVDTYVYSVDNGETGMDLALERDASGEANNWTVSGEFQGTEVEFEIPMADALKGEMTLLEETRQLFAGEEESLQTLVWSPFLDPTTFMPLSFTRDDDEVPYQGIARLGPIAMTTVSDEHGAALSGHMTIGPNTIAFERVWTRGIPTPSESKQ